MYTSFLSSPKTRRSLMRVALEKDFRLHRHMPSISSLESDTGDYDKKYTINRMNLYSMSFTFSDVV
jgi:hypothetical protein